MRFRVSSYYFGDKGAVTKQHTEEQDVIRRGPGLDKCFTFVKWNWSLMTENTRRNMIRIVEPIVR